MGISINCHPRAGGDLKLLKKKDTHLRGYDKFGVNRDALIKLFIADYAGFFAFHIIMFCYCEHSNDIIFMCVKKQYIRR